MPISGRRRAGTRADMARDHGCATAWPTTVVYMPSISQGALRAIPSHAIFDILPSLGLPPVSVLLLHEAEPGREVAAVSEALHWQCKSLDCHCGDWPRLPGTHLVKVAGYVGFETGLDPGGSADRDGAKLARRNGRAKR